MTDRYEWVQSSGYFMYSIHEDLFTTTKHFYCYKSIEFLCPMYKYQNPLREKNKKKSYCTYHNYIKLTDLTYIYKNLRSSIHLGKVLDTSPDTDF